MKKNNKKKKYGMVNNNSNGLEEELSLNIEYEDDDEDDEEEKKGAPAWLSSYSDMMTDLMAIFVILFAFAMMSTSYENKTIKDELNDMKSQMSSNAKDIEIEEGSQYELEDEFVTIFELIKEKIDKGGYADKIQIEKGKGNIVLRFKDNLLFYPDSPVMRENSYEILNYIGDLLAGVEQGIDEIQISGFTAKVEDEPEMNYVSWELSADRAITVLGFLVEECELPNSKMSISGYSHNRPVAGNENEKNRSLNRRVEIKIQRVKVKNIFEKLL